MTYLKDQISLRLKLNSSAPVCEFLAAHCSLSKVKIKDALQKGAVFLKLPQQKQRRIRKATFNLKPVDMVEFNYNAVVLQQSPPEPTLIFNNSNYSIWYKPPGLLTQGSKYGDHCSLLRIAEKYFKPAKYATIIHRLDREVGGLVCIAHRKRTAALLSHLFSTYQVEKRYLGFVEGGLGEKGATIQIDRDIDGKKTKTTIEVQEYTENRTMLEIVLHTGRKHQIRKHLSMIDYPLIGDRRYGGMGCVSGIKLLAYKLGFTRPHSKEAVVFSVPQSLLYQFKNNI